METEMSTTTQETVPKM